jgi:hypothetical protein
VLCIVHCNNIYTFIFFITPVGLQFYIKGIK